MGVSLVTFGVGNSGGGALPDRRDEVLVVAPWELPLGMDGTKAGTPPNTRAKNSQRQSHSCDYQVMTECCLRPSKNQKGDGFAERSWIRLWAQCQ
jgi:hypothetical protein